MDLGVEMEDDLPIKTKDPKMAVVALPRALLGCLWHTEGFLVLVGLDSVVSDCYCGFAAFPECEQIQLDRHLLATPGCGERTKACPWPVERELQPVYFVRRGD